MPFTSGWSWLELSVRSRCAFASEGVCEQASGAVSQRCGQSGPGSAAVRCRRRDGVLAVRPLQQTLLIPVSGCRHRRSAPHLHLGLQDAASAPLAPRPPAPHSAATPRRRREARGSRPRSAGCRRCLGRRRTPTGGAPAGSGRARLRSERGAAAPSHLAGPLPASAQSPAVGPRHGPAHSACGRRRSGGGGSSCAALPQHTAQASPAAGGRARRRAACRSARGRLRRPRARPPRRSGWARLPAARNQRSGLGGGQIGLQSWCAPQRGSCRCRCSAS
mmetsp:Transcript_85480/g.250210  ORF Transcript_85480/g.250210 Transcript_85480/m.250210 type:complete len:276 (-) Transcript_85480:1151-1978(-)